MKQYGLLGKSLSHSFSKVYFEEKFQREGLSGYQYQLFECPTLEALPDLLAAHPDLDGFNVTIPYKKSIIPYLDELSPEAKEVGAVNVVNVVQEEQGGHERQEKYGKRGRLKGYNTDVEGFRMSLEGIALPGKALVLGSGGAAAAVAYVLQQQAIPFLQVSRRVGQGDLTYSEVTAAIMREYPFIINCTPVGTVGQEQTLLPLPYEALTPDHFLYDLVYNPARTPFLQEGERRGVRVQNGLKMLYLQAEASWQIWCGSEK